MDPAKQDRAAAPTLPVEARKRSMAEVELSLSEWQAARECARCLRCDLEFTQPVAGRARSGLAGGDAA